MMDPDIEDKRSNQASKKSKPHKLISTSTLVSPSAASNKQIISTQPTTPNTNYAIVLNQPRASANQSSTRAGNSSSHYSLKKFDATEALNHMNMQARQSHGILRGSVSNSGFNLRRPVTSSFAKRQSASNVFANN